MRTISADISAGHSNGTGAPSFLQIGQAGPGPGCQGRPGRTGWAALAGWPSRPAWTAGSVGSPLPARAGEGRRPGACPERQRAPLGVPRCCLKVFGGPRGVFWRALGRSLEILGGPREGSLADSKRLQGGREIDAQTRGGLRTFLPRACGGAYL